MKLKKTLFFLIFVSAIICLSWIAYGDSYSSFKDVLLSHWDDYNLNCKEYDPYTGILYLYYDVTGDGVDELIVNRQRGKHGFTLYFYKEDDNNVDMIGCLEHDGGSIYASGNTIITVYSGKNEWRQAYSASWNGESIVCEHIYDSKIPNAYADLYDEDLLCILLNTDDVRFISDLFSDFKIEMSESEKYESVYETQFCLSDLLFAISGSGITGSESNDISDAKCLDLYGENEELYIYDFKASIKSYKKTGDYSKIVLFFEDKDPDLYSMIDYIRNELNASGIIWHSGDDEEDTYYFGTPDYNITFSIHEYPATLTIEYLKAGFGFDADACSEYSEYDFDDVELYRFDIEDYDYRTVVTTDSKGALVFQEEPNGEFMYDYKFWNGDQILVNLIWREDGYAIAYKDGVYGYVDASYINWNPSYDIRYDLSCYDYRTVSTGGRGSLVFQTAPNGSFMENYKFLTGDRIFVNIDWRQDGYAIAYQDGIYGYVDASYISWDEANDKRYDLAYYDYRIVSTNGRGSLIFQTSPNGSFLEKYKYWTGDIIYVNTSWRKDGYAIAYQDGTYGYVDASYISWETPNDIRFDLSEYDYRMVSTGGRGSLVFQTSPSGFFIGDYKYLTGDLIYVNLKWRQDNYAIAFQDGVYGYVDASYIDWSEGSGSKKQGTSDNQTKVTTELTEPISASLIDLSKYLGVDFRRLSEDCHKISITSETEKETKLESDYLSVTAGSDGSIVRFRIDSGNTDFSIQGLTTELGQSEAEHKLSTMDYSYLGRSVDEKWKVFYNSESQTYIALQYDNDAFVSMYYAQDGYMPVKVGDNGQKEKQTTVQLTKYLGKYLDDAVDDFPDLQFDHSNIYFKVYTSCSTGVQFTVLLTEYKEAEWLNNLIIEVNTYGGDDNYLIYQFSSGMKVDEIEEQIAANGWKKANGYDGFIAEDGNIFCYDKYNREEPIGVYCLYDKHKYKAYPGSVTEENDLAKLFGMTFKDAKKLFPDMDVSLKGDLVTGKLDGATLRAKHNEENIDDDIIMQILLDKDKPGPYCIYGVDPGMSYEEAERTLNTVGMFYDGGSGEFSDADNNIFFYVKKELLKPHWYNEEWSYYSEEPSESKNAKLGNEIVKKASGWLKEKDDK